MADYNVNLTKEHALKEKMARLGVRESDLAESFIRSSGPGGQNVNKVATAVYLKHIPTGIEVKCGQERSQALNRYAARKILANKIETMILAPVVDKKKRGRPKKAAAVREFYCSTCRETHSELVVMKMPAGDNRWAIFCPNCQKNLTFLQPDLDKKVSDLIKNNPTGK